MTEIKQQKTFVLKLTKFELMHMRDLFSVKLPPELTTTVSQALAKVENRPIIEAALWLKLSKSCREAKLPLNDDAPDYIVAGSASPPIGVFLLASESADDQDEHAVEEGTSMFPEAEEKVEEPKKKPKARKRAKRTKKEK